MASKLYLVISIHFQTNGIFHKVTDNEVSMVHCIYCGPQARISKNIVYLSLKIDFVLANSADPGEMPHYAAFHLGLHCSTSYLLRCFQSLLN